METILVDQLSRCSENFPILCGFFIITTGIYESLKNSSIIHTENYSKEMNV